MAVTHRSDGPLIAGFHHSGDRGLGVLGSQAAASGEHGAGYWFQCLELPADAGKEYKAPILVPPALGTLYAEENGELLFEGPDGVHTYTFGLDEDGVRLFEVTNTIIQGAPSVTGAAAWSPFGAAGGVTGGAPSVLAGAAAWSPFSASGSIAPGPLAAQITGAAAWAAFGAAGAVTAGAPSVVSGAAAWPPFGAAGSVGPGAVVAQVTGSAAWQPFGAAGTITAGAPSAVAGTAAWLPFGAAGQVAGYATPEALDMYTLRAPAEQIRHIGGFAPKDPDAEVVIAFQFKRFTSTPTSPDVSIKRLRGPDDANPNTMLEGVPAVVGSVVYQSVIGGVLHCDYELRCEADGPDGQRHVMVGILPVRPAK